MLVRGVAAGLIFVLGCGYCLAQAASPSTAGQRDDGLAGIISGLRARTSAARQASFGAMLRLAGTPNPAEAVPRLCWTHRELADALSVALIGALESEERVEQEAEARHQRLEEGYIDDYYPALIEAVGALRDRRAIPALVVVAPLGRVAAAPLAELGKGALNAMLDQLRNPSTLSRVTAVAVLADMASAQNRAKLSLADQVTLEGALERSLSSPAASLAARGLAALGRRESLPALLAAERSEQRPLDLGAIRAAIQQIRAH